MLKSTVLACLLLSGIAIASHADIRTISRSGAWENYAGTTSNGDLVCGARVQGRDRAFHVKYTGDLLILQFLKRGWNIPQQMKIQVEMQVDQAPTWSLHTRGDQDDNEVSFIQFTFDWNEKSPTGERYITEFQNLLKNGRELTLRFPDGNERDWSINLSGAADAMNSLNRCAKLLNQAKAPPTQPFKVSE